MLFRNKSSAQLQKQFFSNKHAKISNPFTAQVLEKTLVTSQPAHAGAGLEMLVAGVLLRQGQHLPISILHQDQSEVILHMIL